MGEKQTDKRVVIDDEECPCLKDMYVYFMGYKKVGHEMVVPKEVLQFLEDIPLEQDLSRKIKDGILKREYDKVLLTYDDL